MCGNVIHIYTSDTDSLGHRVLRVLAPPWSILQACSAQADLVGLFSAATALGRGQLYASKNGSDGQCVS